MSEDYLRFIQIKKFNKGLLLLPPELRAIYTQNSEDQDNERQRLVIDYIAGVMDSFALKEYSSYFGASSLAKIYNPDVLSNDCT